MHDLRISLANDAVDPQRLSRAAEFHGATCNRVCKTLRHRASGTDLPLDVVKSIEYGEFAFGGVRTTLYTAPLGSLRKASADVFDPSAPPLPFDVFSRILSDSFSQSFSGGVARRPYPSGGAFYSCQVILYVRRVENLPVGSYHLLPGSHELERLNAASEKDVHAELFLGDGSTLADFDFMILYGALALLPIAKYGLRGYRLATLEAGSMYQNASTVSEELGLRSRVWGGFSDEGLSILLGVDPRSVWPQIAQLFGRAPR